MALFSGHFFADTDRAKLIAMAMASSGIKALMLAVLLVSHILGGIMLYCNTLMLRAVARRSVFTRARAWLTASLLLAGMAMMPVAHGASATASAPEQDCGNAANTLEINACLQKQQEQTEAQLNQVYREVLAQISAESAQPDSPAQMKQQFIAAQRAWISFREKDCQAVYTFWSQGTIRNAMYLGCMRSRAEQRIKELQEYTQP
ncbi:lysozyme inhibitor LprI family protein [Plesiomonas shigelloides]|uniref:lysozyme inhibitor LprI family protein n=1 Tax=Plesiomonas shigelloides TaxID=703 RepID=UPI002883AA5E|nr:lysozyme inhibitor LprI family protein [Plesiomonas shigelloides]MDT1011686.1 lysozyme inhibitor LprI family protein [Plesiomonas shigelloides]